LHLEECRDLFAKELNFLFLYLSLFIIFVINFEFVPGPAPASSDFSSCRGDDFGKATRQANRDTGTYVKYLFAFLFEIASRRGPLATNIKRPASVFVA